MSKNIPVLWFKDGEVQRPRIFPTEEAAVMFAIHILQQV